MGIGNSNKWWMRKSSRRYKGRFGGPGNVFQGSTGII